MARTRAEYERLPRSDDDLEDSDEFKDKPLPRRRRFSSSRFRKARRVAACICRPFYIALVLGLLFIVQLLFNSSYHPSSAPAFKPNTEETVYIAANIIDGDLITGAWGRSVMQLVELIGKDRVFVSVYGGPTNALEQLASMLECPHAIISEEEHPLDMASIPRTTLPNGQTRIKRIAFLAEARNKALEPLSVLEKEGKRFDKVLFLNDVFFSPKGAERLLWGTHIDEATGKAVYKAACAADFVTTWKYYDTFATRDAEGYSLGVPIFPWFPNEGQAVSRNDVLAQKDSVRVKSCWGGMVAFDGRYFQDKTSSEARMATQASDSVLQLPLRFRSEPEPFWDSSECCLIHADIMAVSNEAKEDDEFDTGIYMNPYVRTTYSESTFRYLWLTQRFERLLSPIQRFVNPLAHMPRFNYRRGEREGEIVEDKMWISYINTKKPDEKEVNRILPRGAQRSQTNWETEGFYQKYERTAERGGYCGVRQLLVLKEKDFGEEKNGEGGGNWDNLLRMVPPLDV